MNIKKQRLLSTLLIVANFVCIAQEKSVLNKYEDTLSSLQQNLYAAKSNAEKFKLNTLFLTTMERALKDENSFEYPFDSLKQMAKLTSPDKKFRIINWDLPKDDGTFTYFGFIQVYDSKSKKYILHKLTDRSDEVKSPENYTSDNKKWYGMLYYKIIKKTNKKNTHYILLGFDGNDKISRKKIIDVVKFNNNNVPQFGDAIFKMEKKTVRRVIFEYNAGAVMSLKYNEKDDLIIFDHLAPPNENLKGQFQFYGPDFSYDAMEYSKGKWSYVADIDARNKKNYKDKIYNTPQGTTPQNMPR